MSRSLFYFGVVGVLAMLVHFCTVVWLLVPLGWEPLVANVGGFLLAFMVSYFGHRWFTFSAAEVPHRQALPRFFAVACLGFVVNECLYYLLLRYSAFGYREALLLVLLAVAAMTFLLGRFWAFRKASVQ